MLSAEQIKKIGMFFALAHPNAKAAVHASEKVISHFKSGTVLPSKNIVSDSMIVLECWRAFARISKIDEHEIETNDSQKLFKQIKIDWQVWNKFRLQARADELVALIFNKILGLSEDEVATSLNISIGTLRTRVARAVMQIGQISRAS